jgi:hypothetical protein
MAGVASTPPRCGRSVVTRWMLGVAILAIVRTTTNLPAPKYEELRRLT